MSTFTNPVAIVTGGSRGIGRAIAIAMGVLKWSVVVNYRNNADAAKEVCSAITAAGGKAEAIQADIAIAADRQRLVEQTVKQFGGIDLLVNNAGVAPDRRADVLSVADANEESFDRVIGINLKGPYFLTQLVANQMATQAQGQRRGKIVNITSVSAYAASVNRGDYCIAKAGLAMMTKLFAARMAEFGVNVYEIRPGIIETDMTEGVKAKYDELIQQKDLTPIKRWGKPEDVAKAVVAIATDLLPFSTGAVVDVDGGFGVRRL
jgi:NAD(P)-dependent dehydrogenase (short-subunit alcohol dehydrogenase family)